MGKVKEEELKFKRIQINYPMIGEDGNVDEEMEEEIEKVCLQNSKGERVTNYYYGMESLWGDYYVVRDISPRELKYKYGVIRLKRENGVVIPMKEETVVPIMYDRIAENNTKTVTGYANDRLTYIELDEKSENFGKQIVPAVLSQAVPFECDYEGFAECTVDGVNGYLPRNFTPKTEIEGEELLTEAQVKKIIKYNKVCQESAQALRAYEKLTGGAKSLTYGMNPNQG